MKNYTEKGYKLICDPKFGYLRVDPIPSKEDIVEYYRDKYFSEEKTKGGGESQHLIVAAPRVTKLLYK